MTTLFSDNLIYARNQSSMKLGTTMRRQRVDGLQLVEFLALHGVNRVSKPKDPRIIGAAKLRELLHFQRRIVGETEFVGCFAGKNHILHVPLLQVLRYAA